MKTKQMGRVFLTIAAALAIIIHVSGCLVVPVPVPGGGGGEHHEGHRR